MMMLTDKPQGRQRVSTHVEAGYGHRLRHKVELEQGNSAKGRHTVLRRASVACFRTSQGVRVIDVIKMHNNVFAYASASFRSYQRVFIWEEIQVIPQINIQTSPSIDCNKTFTYKPST